MRQTVNKVLDRNSSKVSVTCLNYEGKVSTNNSEIVNAFNKHFASVGPKLADEIKTESTDDRRYSADLRSTDGAEKRQS